MTAEVSAAIDEIAEYHGVLLSSDVAVSHDPISSISSLLRTVVVWQLYFFNSSNMTRFVEPLTSLCLYGVCVNLQVPRSR
jgi:hypothetical protein